MLQYQVRRGKLTSLGYRVGDATYDLSYLAQTPVWKAFESLILAGDINGAEQLYKLAFSIAASKNWSRVKSGHWSVQYGGHILYVRSTDAVEVYLMHANEASRVPKDLAVKAAEIAYYIRRRWHDQRNAARFAWRDTHRTYHTRRMQ
jgi:hypothetical protein